MKPAVLLPSGPEWRRRDVFSARVKYPHVDFTGNKLRDKQVDVLFDDVGEHGGFINTAGD